MDLKGVQVEVAVNELIGSMVKNGYVSQDANSVLISVQNDDPVVAADLRQKLGNVASQSMLADDVQGAVYSQVVTGNAALREKASQHGISEGRAQFIEELTRQNKNLSFDDLAERTVNDLTLLAKSAKNGNEKLYASGAASDGKYVGRAAAVNAALNHAGVSAAETVLKSVEFDVENRVLVYEVEFYARGNEYEVDVDAVNGTVIEMQHK
ncbi:protein containing Peptidase M4, propeptide, PepSY domain protein, partial [gut metagenome]